jgi:hypothetical protein
MSKIAVSTLHGMNYVCTSLNKVQWKLSKDMASHNLKEVTEQYLMALDVLLQRSQREEKDIISEFVKQSVEGEQVK